VLSRIKHQHRNGRRVTATECADGATVAEYTVLLSLIAIVVLAAVSGLGVWVIQIFNTLANSIA
jgi:Flp pilus assembly pilin Flp